MDEGLQTMDDTGAEMRLWRIAPRFGIAVFLLQIAFAAHPDRDIVFSAQYYKWSGKYYLYDDQYSQGKQQTLSDIGSYHLYRMEPDGGGRKQITFGSNDDYIPRWSPDGETIAFLRAFPKKGFQLCVIGERAIEPVVLFEDSKAEHYEIQDIVWAPDSSGIGISYQYKHRSLLIPLTRVSSMNDKYTALNDVLEIVWSPDSRHVLLYDLISENDKSSAQIYEVKSRRTTAFPVAVRFPLWYDGNMILGQDTTLKEWDLIQRIVVVDSNGSIVRKVKLRPESKRDKDDFEPFYQDGRWVRIPRDRNRLLFESMWGMSDGSHYRCHRLNFKSGRCRRVCEGRLIGVAPDGRQILAADDRNWIGPYKHGGRRCGALTLVDLRSGHKRRLTGRLISVEGGDWRHSTGHHADPKLAVTDERLRKDCREMYTGGKGADRARRELARMPRTELKSRLESIIGKSYPQSMAHASAAYVLANFGIDVNKNTRRMLYCIDIHRWKMPEGYQRPDEDIGSYGPVDKAYIQLYRRYHVNELRFIMEAETDGALGETVDEMLADLAITFPRDVLLTAADIPDVARPVDSTRQSFRHQTGLARLSTAVAWCGGDYQDKAVAAIGRLEKLKNPKISKAVIAFRRELKRAMKDH